RVMIDYPSEFRFGADFKIDGAGQVEVFFLLSPSSAEFFARCLLDDLPICEIACFGGAIPFYSFTAGHNITYTKGTTIHLQLTYRGNHNTAGGPATIQYRVVYNGNTYDSPVRAVGDTTEADCGHRIVCMLIDGRADGYY